MANGNGNGNGNKDKDKDKTNTGNGKDTIAQSLAKAADIAKGIANSSPNKRTSIGPVEDARSGQSGKQFTAVRGGEIDSLSAKERKRLEQLTSGGYE